MSLSITNYDSPIGPIAIQATDTAVSRVEFAEEQSGASAEERSRSRSSSSMQPGAHPLLEEVQRQLAAYFAGDLRCFDLPLALDGTPFQRQVWQQLLSVDYGQTASYQAIAHAIDKDHIVALTMAGKAATASGPTPPGLWWYDDGLAGYEHDVEKAKEYLKKSGYEAGTEIVLAAPGTGIYQKISQLVQEQLQAIGMTVRLEPMAQKGWYGKVVKRQVNFTPMRWTQRPDPDGLLYILFHSDGFANTTHYSNAKVDEALNQARTMTDVPKRAELYSQAQRQIVEDLPYVPLFFAIEYGAIRNHVHGFEWIPDQIPRFRELWKSN